MYSIEAICLGSCDSLMSAACDLNVLPLSKSAHESYRYGRDQAAFPTILVCARGPAASVTRLTPIYTRLHTGMCSESRLTKLLG